MKVNQALYGLLLRIGGAGRTLQRPDVLSRPQMHVEDAKLRESSDLGMCRADGR
jgi:hypothetical protein